MTTKEHNDGLTEAERLLLAALVDLVDGKRSNKAADRRALAKAKGRSIKVTRTSPLTGATNTLDLPIDRRSFRRYLNGERVQYCFPELDVDLREFIMTGFMPGEYELFLGIEPSPVFDPDAD